VGRGGHHCYLDIDCLVSLELGRDGTEAECYLVLLHWDELTLNIRDMNKVFLSVLCSEDEAVASRSAEVAHCPSLAPTFYFV